MDMILTSGISIDVAASGSQIRNEVSDNAVISLAVDDASAAHSATMPIQKASSDVSEKTSVKEALSEVPSTGLVPGEKRSENRRVADA